MLDKYLRKPFQNMSLLNSELGDNEENRIRMTLDTIPESWKKIIDVGCGDGRVSNRLVENEIRLFGIDWAEKRLVNFKGSAIIADIRKPFPFKKTFDGALCAEVLEHLPITAAKYVVENLDTFSKYGYIITVPAREPIKVNQRVCDSCQQQYHIWGHLHHFNSFDDVDNFVGKESTHRVFVGLQGVHHSTVIHNLKKSLAGWKPEDQNLICPYCGANNQKPSLSYNFIQNFLLHVLIGLDIITSNFRPPMGWFICRYEKIN